MSQPGYCNAGAQVPVAVACSAPEARVQPVLETTGLWPALEAVVTAEDVYRGRPDPEAYLLAAQKLQRPPVRCVVIGNSNQVHYCICSQDKVLFRVCLCVQVISFSVANYPLAAMLSCCWTVQLFELLLGCSALQREGHPLVCVCLGLDRSSCKSIPNPPHQLASGLLSQVCECRVLRLQGSVAWHVWW